MGRYALIGALLVWSSTNLWAANSFVIGVEDQDYLPIYGRDKGNYKGFARELLDAFAKNRGYTFTYSPLPVPRLYASFFEGVVDFKFPDHPQWKQDQRTGKQIAYSDPVLAYVDGVVVPLARKAAGADEIRTLGTMSGFTPWAWMDRVKSDKVKLVENISFDALLRQVVAGRVDGAYANVAVVNYQLENVLKQPGALVFAPQLPHSRDHYHLSSIKHPTVLLKFNAWMKTNHSTVDAMKKRYGVEKGVTAE